MWSWDFERVWETETDVFISCLLLFVSVSDQLHPNRNSYSLKNVREAYDQRQTFKPTQAKQMIEIKVFSLNIPLKVLHDIVLQFALCSGCFSPMIVVYIMQCGSICAHVYICQSLCVSVCVLRQSFRELSRDLPPAWGWMIPTIQLFLCGSVPNLPFKGPNTLLAPA